MEWKSIRQSAQKPEKQTKGTYRESKRNTKKLRRKQWEKRMILIKQWIGEKRAVYNMILAWSAKDVMIS